MGRECRRDEKFLHAKMPLLEYICGALVTKTSTFAPIEMMKKEFPMFLSNPCAASGCGCNPGLPRRDFLKLAGLVVAGAALPRWTAIAGPFEEAGFAYSLIPADKKFSATWLRSLTSRGEPTVYRGAELETIGMPVGGICAGQLYLGGDGRLWHWDIFNAPAPGLIELILGPHYKKPLKPNSPLEQGFAIKVNGQVRRLDNTGFSDVDFCGQYPIGTVNYRDAACPVAVKLEAYSPFIPLNAEDSGLPATVMEFAVKNTSSAAVEVELAGWLENAVCKFSPGAVGVRRNRVARDGGMLRVECSAAGGESDDEVFEDFERPGYEGWTVEGAAFGQGPVTQSAVPAYQGDLGMHGKQAVNSHASAPGAEEAAKDGATGKLTSREFTIRHEMIEFLIAGGSLSAESGLHLVVDGKVVRTACGNNDNKLVSQSWDVRDLKGRAAHFEIVDAETGSWGNVGVDCIRFRNAGRADIVFADFEDGTYGDWKTEGTAFGSRPVNLAEMPEHQSMQGMGAHGEALVNSHASAPGADVPAKDGATGKLISPDFTIQRNFIRFLIGGGSLPEESGLHLVVDGKVVRSATGHNKNQLRTDAFEVREFAGQKARLEIVDNSVGGWGNVGVDYIVFTDEGGTPVSAGDAPDFGTLTLALLAAESGDRAGADIGDANPEAVFQALARPVETAEKPIPAKLLAAAGRRWTLAPGEERKAVFVIAWHFPRVEYTVPKLNKDWSTLRDITTLKRYYAKRFRDAAEVAVFLGKDFARLSGETKRWRDTWYDSTLPHWLLDRTLANISTLATTTCHRFDNGRYWFWEGVYSCPGTCTHVWHYAQAVARLFPEIERDIRERVDYGIGFRESDGMISMRAENGFAPATDGHAGTILRTLREHQMSPDGAFLQRNWANIKKAVDWLVAQDENGDGLITRAQPNTLDAEWFGEIAWISSLYIAALKAGAELARETGDEAAAEKWSAIAAKGSEQVVQRLFYKDQYFIQRPDPAHLDKLGSGYGCEIDQVFGQSWAFQVGLDRVLPPKECRKALNSLWRYNFTPDVGPFRSDSKISGGRWYAMPGEGGLVMCTFPDPENPKPVGDSHFAFYFNECMTGFEHQVASHMVWEGGDLVEKGLAVERMIHDRYHASRRNPWNEVEAGDHYGRAMASYGVFTAACGYEHHGPKGHIGFAPRITPENFRAPFTAASGWGTFWQKRAARNTECGLQLRWGTLRLKTLALALAEGVTASKAIVTLGGKPIPAEVKVTGNRALVTFPEEIQLTTEIELHIHLA